MQTKTFNASTERECSAWIDHWQGKRNLYFSVNQTRAPRNKKAEKADISEARWLHVDVDPSPPEEGMDPAEHHDMQRAAILAKLLEYKPAVSLVIDSGGGYQGFWKLAEGVDIEGPADVDRVEALNRRLEHDLGGDHCFNIDRIMRLPGTINLPDARKRKKGRVPALAKVVHATDDVYTALDFKPWTPGEVQEGGGKKDGTKKSKGGDDGLRRPLPEWCIRVIAQGPDPEGDRSYGGDRSKAVWSVCCALVRCGYTDEEVAERISDKANKISEHVLAQANPQRYALRQASRAREKVGSDWQMGAKGGIVANNQHNIRLALAMMEIELSYNAFARQAMIEGPGGLPKRTLTDDIVTEVYLNVEEVFGFRPVKEYFWDVVRNEAWKNPYHPVQQYLDSLQWDGVPRLDMWLTTHLEAEDKPYTRAVGAISLIAAVRRVRQPGVKFDEMLVLISEQGTGKSSAIAVMAVEDDWFTDSVPLNADDKVVIENMSGKWIIEAAELKGMRRGEVEHLKAFMSRQVDRARMAWGRIPLEVPRQNIFMGTTNSDTFLRDQTGNRRFWPVQVGRIDTAKLREARDQIWAEAAMREAAGESIRLPEALWPSAALEQERRQVEDPWILDFAKPLRDIDRGKLLCSDAWIVLNIPVGQRTQEHNVRLGEVMRVLGWERKKLKSDGHPQWHYAKGESGLVGTPLPRILISRDEYGVLSVMVEGGAGPVPRAPEIAPDIPF